MLQSKYEAKKALLKRIKYEWGARLRFTRGQGGCGLSTLHYGTLVCNYTEAQEKLANFIHSSIRYHRRKLL